MSVQPAQRLESLAERAAAVADRARSFTQRHRGALGIAAIAVFAVSLGLALRGNAVTLLALDWRPLGWVAGIAALALVVQQIPRTWLTARLAGSPLSWPRARRLTLMSIAANQLPVPAGPLVRAVGMQEGEVRYRQTALATLLAALLWGGMTFLYVLILSWSRSPTPVVAILATISILALLGFGLGVRWMNAPGSRPAAAVLAINFFVAAFLFAWRIQLCLQALGVEATLADASITALVPFLSGALLVVPGSIGVRELLVAGLGTLNQLPMDLLFLAAVLNRLIDLAALLVFAGVSALLDRTQEEEAGDPDST